VSTVVVGASVDGAGGSVVVATGVGAGVAIVVEAPLSEPELLHAASSRHDATTMVMAGWRIAES